MRHFAVEIINNLFISMCEAITLFSLYVVYVLNILSSIIFIYNTYSPRGPFKCYVTQMGVGSV